MADTVVTRPTRHTQSVALGNTRVNSSLTRGLVALWRMEEAAWDGSNAEVRDVSGNSDVPVENQIQYSEVIVTQWMMFGTTTGSSDSADTGPDGQSNLSNIADADATNHAQFSTDWAVGNNETYTISAYFKKTTSASTFPAIALQYINGVNIISSYAVNTDTGSITKRDTSTVADSTEVQSVGNFWRVSITFANDASGNNTGRIILYGAINTNASDTWVSSTQGFVLAGYAQASKRSSSIAYTKTSGAAIEQLFNHGTAVGGLTTVAGGKLGRGTTMNGTTQYISTNDPSALVGDLDTLSIAMWFKTTVASGAIVLIAWPSGANSIPSISLNQTTDRVIFQLETNNWRQWIQSPVVNDGEWHHIVVTLPGAAQTDMNDSTCYIDGVLQVIQGTNVSGVQRAKSSFNIGSGGAFFFKDTMDEVGIWNRVLSKNDAIEIYNNEEALAVV